MNFLNNKYAKAVTVVLLLEVAAFYWFARRSETTPAISPLSQFPATIGSWHLFKDLPVEAEVEAVLKADDTLSRVYANGADQSIYLFVAFFKTQRAGQAPHSPKNCLPGAGWEPLESTTLAVDIPGRPTAIKINKYVVANGSNKSVTLYWYQSRQRIIASEYAAKFWLVADSVRYHRSDTSLVKVEVHVVDNNIEAAAKVGISFVQTAFSEISHSLPN